MRIQRWISNVSYYYLFVFNLRITDEDLREFFPLPRVITGIFRLVQNLFDVTIEELKRDADGGGKGKKMDRSSASPLKVWSQGVKLFKVSDTESGKELGHFYFDPYIRYDMIGGVPWPFFFFFASTVNQELCSVHLFRDDKSFNGSDKGWYVPIRPRSSKVGCQPVGALIMSLPQPGK